MHKTIRRGFTQQHFEGHYVYLLKSLNFDEYYIGSTNDLEKRLAEHNDGRSFHTKKYSPWTLEYYEAYKTEELAREREKALKKHGNAKRGLKMRAGVSGTIAKITKNAAGFTLVEMMVVMAIIAILAVIGLSALLNINRGNIVDRATEEIVTAIRESQNKAISVANNPTDDTAIPLAWDVQVDPGAKTVKLFVITNLLSTSNVTKAQYGDIDVSTLDSITVSGGREYLYTTPFGKYYSANVYSETGWSKNSQRPYDIIPPQSSAKKTIITLKYKGNVRTVVIETNGDVYAQ